MTEAEVDSERVAWVVRGKSLELRALGKAKNLDAERAAFNAINSKSNSDALRAAATPEEIDAIMAPIIAIETAEVARQKADETPEERKLIAKYVWTHSANPSAQVCGGLRNEAYVNCLNKNDPNDMAGSNDAPASVDKDAQAEAEADRPRIEAEVKAKIEAERAQIEAEAKAKVRAQIEADLRAKAVADAMAKAEADAKADIAAAQRAKDKAAAEAKVAAEAKAEAEAVARNEDNARAAKEAAEASARADKLAADTKASADALRAAQAKAAQADADRAVKAATDAEAQKIADSKTKILAEVAAQDKPGGLGIAAIYCALLDHSREKYAELERAGRGYWFGSGDSAGQTVFRNEAYCRILQKHHAEDLVAKNYSKFNPAASPVFPKLDPAN